MKCIQQVKVMALERACTDQLPPYKGRAWAEGHTDQLRAQCIHCIDITWPKEE